MASNPFNELSNAPEGVTHAPNQVDHCKQYLPCPRWSARQLSDWLHEKLSCPEDRTIWSIVSCWQYCLPTPSITTTRNGLFPAFYNDIFGIQGVPGLSQWILDSGATSSCTSDLTLFTSLSADVPFKRIRVANGKYAHVQGIGTIQLKIMDSKNSITSTITLKDVLYIPEVPVNLISTRSLWNHSGISTTFADCCTLRFKDGTSITFDTGSKSGHYYCIARTSTSHADARNADSSQPSNYACTICGDCPSIQSVSADTVHARLGHPSAQRAERALSRSMGLPETPRYAKHLQEHCEGCRLGGARKRPLHDIPQQFQPKVFGDRIHSDLCGEFPPSVTFGYKYILSFVDSATGWSEIYLLKSKHSSEVKDCFENFIKKWKHKLPNGVVREWFTDNGGEFTSASIDEFCDEFVVKRGFTVPYCSPQNAQAERLWGILQRCMRIMFAHSALPVRFWHYAAKHANMLHNLLPRATNEEGMSPWEALHGTKPDFSNVRVWGCLSYCTLRNEHDRDNRMSPTGVKAVHLGCDERRRGWVVYIPSLNRITSSRDIVFNEEKFLRFDKHGHVRDDTERFVEDDGPQMDPIRVYNDTLQPARWRDTGATPNEPQPQQQQQQPPQQQQQQHQAGNRGQHHDGIQPGWAHRDASDTHYSTKQCAHPKCQVPSTNGVHDDGDERHSFERVGSRLRNRNAFISPDSCIFHVTSNVDSDQTEDPSEQTWSINPNQLGNIPVPRTYEEAMASRFAHKWKEAMEREIRELLGRKTWESVTIPYGRKATKSRWVFAIKYLSDGTIERFKARFVVCGYSQIHGVDYEQSFSSTMRATTFRTLVALAAQENLVAEHIDISNAFCQADIDGVDIWVQPPRGFEGLCQAGEGLKLLKALYGTKQASYLWQQTLSKWLTGQGFKRLATDPCVFIKLVNGKKIIVGCYVDDLVVLHDASTKMFQEFKRSFLQSYGGRFDGKHIGRLEWFLGVKVDQRADGSIHINQSKYINDLLNKFIPNSDTIAFSRRIPYTVDGLKSLAEASSDEEIERMRKLPYLQIVGALLYLSVMSRPDISHHMSVLCSFMQNPSYKCYEAAQSVLLYVGSTRHLSIKYSRTFAVPECLHEMRDSIKRNRGFYGFSDASWTVPKSACGHVVFLGGGPIAWQARKLHVIADSVALAEYSAASGASKEIAFVRNLLSELHVSIDGPVALGVDNSAAIKISEQRGVSKLTKHFAFSAHRIRDEVEHLRLRCIHVDTENQTADVFTKPLADPVFLRHRDAFFGR